MVFLANLGVNLHGCLCGDLQVASAQTLDFIDIGQKSSFPDWKLFAFGRGHGPAWPRFASLRHPTLPAKIPASRQI